MSATDVDFDVCHLCGLSLQTFDNNHFTKIQICPEFKTRLNESPFIVIDLAGLSWNRSRYSLET